MPPYFLILAGALYVIAGRYLVKSRIRGRDALFALLNLAVVNLVFLKNYRAGFFLYVAIVSVQYVVLAMVRRPGGLAARLAFLMPIGILAAVRFVPLVWIWSQIGAFVPIARRFSPDVNLGAMFLGLSYLAFRTSYLVTEVANGVVPRPGFWRYLSFAFFAPTLSVGPISPYSEYNRAFAKEGPPAIPMGRALVRVLIGAVKFRFLGPILDQLSYAGLLLDEHPHHWVDLPIAAVAYYLYLYCNFSGFCDMAIGAAGLMGVPVAENFANPFAARNLQDFWNRWHITLSHYMRDVVFSPLSKFLVRRLGPAWINHIIAFSIFVVFLLVGVWHGVGWNYLAWGAAHGFGLAAVHYYTVFLKKRLGKQRFARYEASPVIRAVSTAVTFAYVAAAMFLFANDGKAMGEILSRLR